MTVIGLVFAWLTLSAFNIPSYQPDQALVDELGYIGHEDRVRIVDEYQAVRDTKGVRIVTAVMGDLGEGEATEALTALLNEWQLTRTVLAVINPENGEVGYAITKDIQESVIDSGIVGDRLKSDVQSGNLVPGIVYFYQDFPLDGIGATSSNIDPSEIIQYNVEDTGDTTAMMDVATIDLTLSTLDWIMVGIASIVVLGMLGYAYHVQRINKGIEADILVFIPFKVVNEGLYTDKEIWDELLDAGQIQYDFTEYNKYLDSPQSRRLTSTGDRFVQDDYNARKQ